jgi:hypothetical protein
MTDAGYKNLQTRPLVLLAAPDVGQKEPSKLDRNEYTSAN